MADEASKQWLSAHIFHGGGLKQSDSLLLEVIKPFVVDCLARQWADQYFFIRYGELGPHVRLRIYGDATRLVQLVRPALEQRIADREGHQPGAVALEGASTTIRWMPYEPEVQRYGGPDGIAVGERLFYYSSESALALLPDCAADEQARLGIALSAMLVLLAAFTDDRERAGALADRYVEFWQHIPAPDVNWHALLNGFEAGYDRNSEWLRVNGSVIWRDACSASSQLPTPLATYASRLRGIVQDLERLLGAEALVWGSGPLRDWPAVTRKLVGSYLHMMNNRLGVNRLEEIYLAYLIGRFLRE
ncbi:MAG: thiopeptide-type bacteriocin biosynthesis protein [Gemmatimonadota bacterium]